MSTAINTHTHYVIHETQQLGAKIFTLKLISYLLAFIANIESSRIQNVSENFLKCTPFIFEMRHTFIETIVIAFELPKSGCEMISRKFPPKFAS